MPIPDLDADGFLPAGVHDCSLDEVKKRFGTFRATDRRPKLFERLEAICREAFTIESVAELIVDGSFVTGTSQPNDIDLILVLSRAHDFSVELRPFEYNAISARRVRRIYGFDMLVARHGSAAYHEYVDFFSQVRAQPGRRKGILRLKRD